MNKHLEQILPGSLKSPIGRDYHWNWVKNFVRENLGITTGMSLLLLVMVYVGVSWQIPVESFVQQVLAVVMIFGVLGLMALSIRMALHEDVGTMGGVARQLVWYLITYFVVLWMIGAIGDNTYRWIIVNPNTTAEITVSLLICWAILRISKISKYAAPSVIADNNMAPGIALRKTPTPRDDSYTAAHEAGHTLLYAVLDELPGDFKVIVNEYADPNGSLGSVSAISYVNCHEEKLLVEWEILVLLAGQLGEEAILGSTTMGSGNDYHRWLGYARRYLANHYRGIYYDEPQNKFEQEQNEAKLQALQAGQVALLHKFFAMNAELLKQLADTLLEKRSMGREQITPFLSRATLPDGFPRPCVRLIH
ncbi:MAG: hypothetical protein LBI48_09445 [Burkholderiaceae bacterium]|jgi:hypothetical protein|nr:hypothetical protein [Burkholderiaceae bacterium]